MKSACESYRPGKIKIIVDFVTCTLFCLYMYVTIYIRYPKTFMSIIDENFISVRDTSSVRRTIKCTPQTKTLSKGVYSNLYIRHPVKSPEKYRDSQPVNNDVFIVWTTRLNVTTHTLCVFPSKTNSVILIQL